MPFHVYILASRTRVLYTGVTSDLERRVQEHKLHLIGGFTQRYNVDRLVYFEEYTEPLAAIAREKRIKRMTRAKKVALIERANATWRDLAPDLRRTGKRGNCGNCLGGRAIPRSLTLPQDDARGSAPSG